MTAQEALHLMQLLASIGIAITVSECLYAYSSFREDGLMAWKIGRSRSPFFLEGPAARAMDRMFRFENFRWVLWLRLLIAVTLVFYGWTGGPLLTLLLFLQVVGIFLTRTRSYYGTDGAGQMLLITMIGLLAASLMPNSGLVTSVAIAFVAAQSVLAYTIAGVAKLIAPEWRSGRSLVLLLERTNMYGNARLHRLFRRFPWMAMAASAMVIGFEVLFPLALLGESWMLAFMAIAMTFHVVLASTMHLNKFIWAFVSTYPALWFVVAGDGRPWV